MEPLTLFDRREARYQLPSNGTPAEAVRGRRGGATMQRQPQDWTRYAGNLDRRGLLLVADLIVRIEEHAEARATAAEALAGRLAAVLQDILERMALNPSLGAQQVELAALDPTSAGAAGEDRHGT